MRNCPTELTAAMATEKMSVILLCPLYGDPWGECVLALEMVLACFYLEACLADQLSPFTKKPESLVLNRGPPTTYMWIFVVCIFE